MGEFIKVLPQSKLVKQFLNIKTLIPAGKEPDWDHDLENAYLTFLRQSQNFSAVIIITWDMFITYYRTFLSIHSQIVIWDPQHLRSLHTLPTLGGFAYSVAISPLDPGTLGVGVGDNMLRVWQTTSSMGPYETLTLWQGIKSKVMVVSSNIN